MNNLNRRKFLKASAFGATAIASLSATTDAIAAARSKTGLVAKNDTILFQGDSITDAGRSRDKGKTDAPNNQAGLGNGYAWLAAVELLVDQPTDDLKIFNRGVSGNKVYQLADRWPSDCLELKPDVLSIMIGVNDYWHTVDPRLNYKGTVEIYEHDYRALIERTKKALPKVKLIICEPFLLHCGAVSDSWLPDFAQFRAAAKRVAKKYRAAFVPFQAMFDEAVKYAPPEQWAGDGVHPTPAGAALMAHFWVTAVSDRT